MSILKVNEVTWRRENQVILDNVSWEINPGEHWALIGVNGSGKTSLLNMINGYIWPTNGSVEVLGKPFGKFPLAELRKSIGWVSSAFGESINQLRPGETALEVVVSGKFASIGIYEDVTRDDANQGLELLERFGCAHLAMKHFQVLSQGEQQRVLIARAWMAQPELLILDEPCTGLDVLAREKLLQSVQRLGDEENAPTVVYVTHHIEEVLPLFTHVLLLKGGKVLASGRTSEVMTSHALSQAFGIEVDVSWHGERPWLRVV